MKFSQPSDLFKKIYPSLSWDIQTKKNHIYLTFDDGPTPGVTNLVLDKLKAYSAKATFFCVGNNIQKHPQLFKRIIKEGHTVGNHTFNHMNGWKNSTSKFLNDVKLFDDTYQSKLFRPPYGRIKSSQISALKKDYKIVMWSILTKDYDPLVSPKKCLNITLKKLIPGAIIVFHDSVKAKRNMLPTLEALLEEVYERGWQCKKIKNKL